MSTPLISHPRRVLARTCYYAAATLAAIGIAMLFIAFNGNLWVVGLLGALSLLIAGNAIAAPKSCRPNAAATGTEDTDIARSATAIQRA